MLLLFLQALKEQKQQDGLPAAFACPGAGFNFLFLLMLLPQHQLKHLPGCLHRTSHAGQGEVYLSPVILAETLQVVAQVIGIAFQGYFLDSP